MTYDHRGKGQTSVEVAKAQLEAFASSATAAVKGGPGAQSVGQVLVDTAIVYQQGATEETIGQILSDNPALRSQISFATKANNKHETFKCLSGQSVIHQCNESLKSLGIDCIDLYYLHTPGSQNIVRI